MSASTPQEPSGEREAPAWHALPPDEVLRRLEGEPDGLSGAEAAARLERHGKNELPAEEGPSALQRFVRQFNNVLIYVLLASAVGTALLAMWVDTGVILAVVLINSLIGFIQEGKAERALAAIRQMLSPKARVRRDGRQQQIDAELLVPGDIVQLGPGDRVPADLRLLSAKNLRADEAVLTGESEPVDKDVSPIDADSELGDRSSVAFSGTLVAAGQATGVVVATGRHTELGHISTLVGEVEELTTPLLGQIARFSRALALGVLGLAAATFALGFWVRGYPLEEIFLAAVSLAVAAIPEGLPAIMTITLAIGVQKMARRNAIIRRLPAVETLGAVSVIFSDKTGTLTRNEMTLTSVITAQERFEVSGVGYEPRGAFSTGGQQIDPQQADPVLGETLRAGLLCNDARLAHADGRWTLDGEPTEGALVTGAVKAGFDQRELNERFPRLDVIPFESGHKFMATLHRDSGDQRFIYLKGAPERVLERCARVRTSGGDEPLDRERWTEVMESIAAEGRRLLALATKDAGPGARTLDFAQVEGGMTLLGLVGIVDPPREEAISAVRECGEAGIRVKMITGDHKLTARAVADALGIDTAGGVVSGREIERMDGARLAEVAAKVNVFARASPEHKLRLIESSQARRAVVAMTGDGVNDAPALKRADVGIAMGVKGTEVSKEASEIVLADDNFATIAAAVKAGRTVYDNLLKSILFVLPTNIGEAFTIVAAIVLGVALPLAPVQVLWVNMVTAVTLAMALAFEPSEPGVMRRAPRDPGSPILSGFLLWRIAFVSVLLVGGTFGHFLWMHEHGADLALSRTAAINTLVAGQVFYLFNSRYIRESSLRRTAFRGSRAALIAVGVLILLQAAFTYLGPLQRLFGTAPLALADWARVLLFGVLVFVAVELEKALLRRRAQG